MNDTEQLFIAAAIWALIAGAIARSAPNWSRSGRIAFFVSAVALPFWELPYGYYNFQKLCREGLDLRVSEKISPQESVCADYPYVTLHKRLLDSGFAVVETRGKSGEITNFTVRADGKILETARQELQSKYCLTFVNNNQMPWGVLRHDQLIARAQDRHVVASQSRFSWSGMWWQLFLQPIFGGGGECSSEKNHLILALRNGAG